MRKIIIAIIIFVNLINIKNTEARLMYSSPEIKGQIIDTATGKPIEKAIVRGMWWGYGAMQLGGGASPFKIVTVITGKDGKYIIPGYTKFYIRGIGSILNTFSHQSIEVYHPLYVDINLGSVWEKDNDTGKEKYQGIREKDGNTKLDVKLVGVEEAIRRGAEEYRKTGKSASFQYGSYIGTYSGSFFKDHWDKKFVEDVLKKWEEIRIKCCPNNGYIKDQLENVKKQVEEAYKGEK